MTAARGVRIHHEATLTLQIANDLYYPSNSINFNPPDGINIFTKGNPNDNTLVKLEFSDTDGLVLTKGYQIGGITDITIQGDGTALSGLRLEEGALAYASNLILKDLEHGLDVFEGSSLFLSGLSTVQNIPSDGVRVYHDSLISGENALEISGVGAKGIRVEGVSTAILNGLSSTNNTENGVAGA